MEGLYRPLPHTRATGNGRDPERDEILERVPSIEPPYEAARDFFRRHLSEASSAIGNDGDGHADEEAVAPPEIFIDGGIFSAVLTALVGLVAVGLPWLIALLLSEQIAVSLAGLMLIALATAAIAARSIALLGEAIDWIDMAMIIVGFWLIGIPPTVALDLRVRGSNRPSSTGTCLTPSRPS
jgi:hypothetical protein